MKSYLFIIIALFSTLMSFTSCSEQRPTSVEVEDQKGEASDLEIILFNDDTGEIRDGSGNRVCGYELMGGRNKPHLYLKSEIDFFGVSTKYIYLYGGYAYVEFGDALDGNYENGIAYSKEEKGTEIHYYLKNTQGKKLQKADDKGGRSKKSDSESSSSSASSSSDSEYKPETNTVKQKGWAFLLKHLKSPSTASLVGYADPSAAPCQDLAKSLNLPGLGVAMYQVDAQNSYGAMIRQNYLVFFKNGSPVNLDEAESIANKPAHIIRSWLSLNGW